MDTVTPLFKRLTTGRNRYIYDPATNRIFSVSRFLFDNFERIAALTQSEVEATPN